MSTPTLKQIVKNSRVYFDSYRQGHFYYNVLVTNADEDEITTEIYQFPVPLEDIGTATLLAVDKAITFMRWIRRAIEDKTFVKI